MTFAELSEIAGEHAPSIWKMASRAANQKQDVSLSHDDLLSEGLLWMTVALSKWKEGSGNKHAFVYQVVKFGIIQYEREAIGDKRWSTFRSGIYPVSYEELKDSRRSKDMETTVFMMDHKVKLGKMTDRERITIEAFMSGMSGPDARRFLLMSRSMYDRTLKAARRVYETGEPSPKINNYSKKDRQ